MRLSRATGAAFAAAALSVSSVSQAVELAAALSPALPDTHAPQNSPGQGNSVPQSGAQAQDQRPAVAATTDTCDCVTVPALTTVDIEIMAPLGSATSKDGDQFPIRLAAPVFLEGRAVIPVGALGVGEVIHAQKSGMGGGGGELLLAARYLEVDGRRMRLRSFRASRFGQNQTNAALMTSVAFGVFGLAVKGKNTQIAAGTVAEAKVAEPFVLPRSSVPQPSAEQSAASENSMPAPSVKP